MHRLFLLPAAAGLITALAAPAAWALGARAAQVQLQLSCSGTALETRGSATLKRAVAKLNVSLTLEAEGPSSKVALALLQERLDVVRTRLKALAVQDLRVTSPNVWARTVSAGKPAVFAANSQVSGTVAPTRLQELISTVGSLPGVRLLPVDAVVDQTGDAASTTQLVQAAYRDALKRGQDLAAALGLSTLRPLQVQIEGGVEPIPMMATAMVRTTPAPFDPQELPQPTDRLSLAVTFCATP